MNDRKYPTETDMTRLLVLCTTCSIFSVWFSYRGYRRVKVQKSPLYQSFAAAGFLAATMLNLDKLVDLQNHRAKYPELYKDN